MAASERDIQRELKLAQREIERLRARLSIAVDKELSLLNAIIRLKEQLAAFVRSES
jgi:hypothetical protein